MPENPRVGSSILPLSTNNFKGLANLGLAPFFLCENLCEINALIVYS